MASFTEKDVEFLSNPDLIDLLRSLLLELDIVAGSGAHRSTTYLAVSAMEGLFGELLKLLRIQASDFPEWPKDNGTPNAITALKLHEKEKILQAANALPTNFENLYRPVRVFRNYMHPERELKELTPIARSVAQVALGCLNAVIEKYKSQRFIAEQIWELKHGLAQVPAANLIQMPQFIDDRVSLLVSASPAEQFLEMSFLVIIPPDAIFNFIYNYVSLDQWRAARIEGREIGRGWDDGQILCTKWRAWAIGGRYTKESEPNPKKRQHRVRVILDPPEQFSFTVDDIRLTLQEGVNWEFDPKGRVGFMTEWGAVSVADLEVQVK